MPTNHGVCDRIRLGLLDSPTFTRCWATLTACRENFPNSRPIEQKKKRKKKDQKTATSIHAQSGRSRTTNHDTERRSGRAPYKSSPPPSCVRPAARSNLSPFRPKVGGSRARRCQARVRLQYPHTGGFPGALNEATAKRASQGSQTSGSLTLNWPCPSGHTRPAWLREGTTSLPRWDDVPVPCRPVSLCVCIMLSRALPLYGTDGCRAVLRAGGSISLLCPITSCPHRPSPSFNLPRKVLAPLRSLYCKVCHRLLSRPPCLQQETWYCGAGRPAAEGTLDTSPVLVQP